MKIRKHKNNRTFLITFTTLSPSRTETHLNSDGSSCRVRTECVVSPVSRVWATGSCKQSVMRAFLFGHDAGNMTTIIREAKPLAWGGRLVTTVASITALEFNSLLPVV